MKNYIKYLGILALGIISCEPEFENPIEEQTRTVSSGEADFSHYVALGNSLTAGYADNALYISGQEYSYPNILAEQFAMAGGGEFTQPLMADDAGGLLLNGDPLPDFGNRLVLAFGPDGPSPMVYTGMEPTTEVSEPLSGPFNNMGVPGAKSFHLGFVGYGNVDGVEAGLANPYFARFASGPQASVITDAVQQDPTFFSLWIGNNDVLSYAISGGEGEYQLENTNPGSYGKNDITNRVVFDQTYKNLVSQLIRDGAEGILINIPNVTDVPYFTTVPYAPLDPTNEEFGSQIPTLNEMFGKLNQAFTFLGVPERSIEFSETAASPVIIMDESLSDISEQLKQALQGGGMDEARATLFGRQFGQARQATAEDLLVLTSMNVIGRTNADRKAALQSFGLSEVEAEQLSKNGVTYPMKDGFVLTPEEQENIASATAAFNSTISEAAQSNNLAFLDANALLSQLSSGGITATDSKGNPTARLTSTFVTGGAFSLDGVHLTPRGNALVANKIIEEINETFDATLRKVNVGNYKTFTPSNEVN